MTTEGDELRARRARLGIDVKPLAELAGVNRNTLSAIEAGQGFRSSSLGKIERALEQLEAEASHYACVTGAEPDRAISGLERSATRGRAIKARRLRHGIKSVRQLAEQSGVSREAVTAAEDGQASESSYARLEAWFDRFEEETGAVAKPSTGPRMVSFRIGGLTGDVDVVVEGPIEEIDKLRETVERLLHAANGGHREN